jgi:hypothetical protein
MTKKQTYYSKNKEKIKIYSKRYYLKNKIKIRKKAKIDHKINKLKHNLRDKIYYQKNKEKLRLKKHKHYIKNKTRLFLRKKQYLKENPEKMAYWNKTRRERKKNVIHNYTKKDWTKKLTKYKNICPICLKKTDKLSPDHIPPLCKTNKGHIYNLKDVTPICLKCNHTKNGKDITYKQLKQILKEQNN